MLFRMSAAQRSHEVAPSADAVLTALASLLRVNDGSLSSSKGATAVVDAVKKLVHQTRQRDTLQAVARSMLAQRDFPGVVAHTLKGAADILQAPHGTCTLHLVSVYRSHRVNAAIRCYDARAPVYAP